MEEHSIYGGLGSAVAEVLSEEYPVPVSILGTTEFAESGDLDELMEKYGFGARNIAARAKEVMTRKGMKQ